MDDGLEDLQLNSDEGLNIKSQQQKFFIWCIENKIGTNTFAIENFILNIQDRDTRIDHHQFRGRLHVGEPTPNHINPSSCFLLIYLFFMLRVLI